MTELKLLNAATPESLERLINERLADGWMLHGSLVQYSNSYLMQAMIKKTARGANKKV